MKSKLTFLLFTTISLAHFSALIGQTFDSKTFAVDWAEGAPSYSGKTNEVVVPVGETWEIANIYGGGQEVEMNVFIGGSPAATRLRYDILSKEWRSKAISHFSSFQASEKYPAPIVTGPATIQLVSSVLNYVSEDVTVQLVLVYQVYRKDTSSTPSNSVVIPADATGPVEIILESSEDLVTWTAALPGEYGASTAKRFFRVRAVAKP